MDVSVIIPVYNTEKYLTLCIDSILQQENVSFEIIIVDDGSTDSSPSICDAYASKYENIRTIHIHNSGPATAKNEGLKHARGNYITFTDSDDKMAPLMLHKMVSVGYKYDADIICCNYKEIDEEGHSTCFEYTNKIYILNHEEGLIHFLSRDKINSTCWTKLYKRQMLIDYQIQNNPGLHTEEDSIFNIKAFRKSRKAVIVDEPLYVYTHREGSLAHGYFKKNISQHIDNRIKRIQIIQKSVFNESDIVKEWSIAYIIMFYNELLGKVALFPDYYTDQRIVDIFYYIKENKKILRKHHGLCGFSKTGMLLILYLPINLYLRYRRSKIT